MALKKIVLLVILIFFAHSILYAQPSYRKSVGKPASTGTSKTKGAVSYSTDQSSYRRYGAGGKAYDVEKSNYKPKKAGSGKYDVEAETGAQPTIINIKR